MVSNKEEIYNHLWSFGMNLYGASSDCIKEYLEDLNQKRIILGEKNYFRLLTNLLYLFYSSMDTEVHSIYLRLILSIGNSSKDIVSLGDMLEVLGILVKGCTFQEKQLIFEYVKKNIYECLSDPAATVSACNCIRYLYPEINNRMQQEINVIMKQLCAQNTCDALQETLNFTKEILLRSKL